MTPVPADLKSTGTGDNIVDAPKKLLEIMAGMRDSPSSAIVLKWKNINHAKEKDYLKKEKDMLQLCMVGASNGCNIQQFGMHVLYTLILFPNTLYLLLPIFSSCKALVVLHTFSNHFPNLMKT